MLISRVFMVYSPKAPTFGAPNSKDRIQVTPAKMGKVKKTKLLEDDQIPAERKLAALLGMTPEYLSRAFTTLKDYGVEVTGGKIHLKNLDALIDLAKPNPLIDRKVI